MNEHSDLVSFGYDLSDIQDGLKCWRKGFIYCDKHKDSGELSRAHRPSC